MSYCLDVIGELGAEFVLEVVGYKLEGRGMVREGGTGDNWGRGRTGTIRGMCLRAFCFIFIVCVSVYACLCVSVSSKT